MAALADVYTTTFPVTSSVNTDPAIGVNVTWSPDGHPSPGVQQWSNKSGGIQVGYSSFTMSMRKPTRDSKVTRVTVKVILPTLEVTAPTTVTGIQPAPTLAYSHSAVLEFFMPERGTGVERTALLTAIQSLLVDNINASDGTPSNPTKTPVTAAIKDLEPPYSL
jgi:hypothetical protein